MPTREQITSLLDEGHTYETAARALKIPPGQAYLTVTGIAADGGQTPPPEEVEAKRVLGGSAQHLVNPPPVNPTRKGSTMAWVRERAARELSGGAA